MSASSPQPSRRNFLIGTAISGGAVLAGCMTSHTPFTRKPGQGVTIYHDSSESIVSEKPTQWAIEHLRQSLAARNVRVRTCTRRGDIDPADVCVCITKMGYPPVTSTLMPTMAAMRELLLPEV